ncbi:hypothetical protein MERGE_000412 [Pneumocystis wakefieldiae]|uniref:Transcription initiation factor IIA subunit 2 n=1 Tax=Pneumocystis wakefieldiae TaxID=38082 RepID=A0A899FV90_9ASCO|nr:hypothetical protein MERGE_000412 [Pneumocystis wakefieldiae]
MSNIRYYELYRRSSIGISLTDALDDLIREGQIPPQLAMKILLNFDKSITDNLTEKVRSRMTFRVSLVDLCHYTYRFCDEVWTFIIKNPSFRLENDTLVSDKIKIVACNSKRFFSGKICLISGGSRGIGLGIAQRFAKEGNRCILVSRNENNLKSAIRSLPSSQNHEYYCLDVRNSYQWEQLAKKIDKLHVLVNAAGISQYSFLPKASVEDIENIISTNLLGSIYSCRIFLRHFLKNKGGSIINISSSITLSGGSGATVYAASKAGISALSAEWASKGIKVNAISPGYVDTHMLSQMNKEMRDSASLSNHMRRFGNIEEIASAAFFLASNDFITGTTLYIDGGI